jgi:hypothetical protein
MIVFDLACARGHVFEAWFGSSADYEDQRARQLIACPLCGSEEIGKAVMAPRVAIKGNRRPDAGASLPAEQARGANERGQNERGQNEQGQNEQGRAVAMASPDAPPPAMTKEMLKALAAAQAEMLAKSDYVGPGFASEARAIHDGDSAARPIHGEATGAEVRALIADGIAVAPLPFPVRPPGTDN